MPKVRRNKKPPPDGWDEIEDMMEQFEVKMREAELEPHEGKRQVEALWPIIRIHNQRTRYLFDLHYKRKAITKELLDFCVKERYADKQLIAKWKKNGYENLCCMRCIQPQDTNFGTMCVCRVPRKQKDPGRVIKCQHCGCQGCC
jgi:bud site selection protein 31